MTAPLGLDDKKRLVEFLLRRTFPGTWAAPPILPVSINGRRTGTDPGAIEAHNVLMARIEAERKRLWALSDAELREAQAAELAKDKAKRDAELAKLDAVFQAPENAADFDYWTKAEYWTLDEAVALLLGKDPKKLPLLLISSHLNAAPFKQQYVRLHELAMRASAMQGPRLRPRQVVAWADTTKAVEVPPQLRSLPDGSKTLEALGITAQPERLMALDAQVRADREQAQRQAAQVPDWDLWGSMKLVELWQAVALSLNINPGTPQKNAGVSPVKDPAKRRQLGPEFERRLIIALSNLSTNGPLVPQRVYMGALDDPCVPVNLKDFRAFSEGLPKPWALPPEFPGNRQTVAVSAVQAMEPPREEPQASGWKAKKPARMDALAAAIHRTLVAEHKAGHKRPTATALLELWRADKPDCIVRIHVDGVDWTDDGREEATADRGALSDRISRMTE